ncbi:S1 family peptidase [Streptomyces sp. NPDC048357]|uniref:S1 family peptidase n=1 Tax=Streptomyces sp. NPDC048357 TaxID=3154719 RepID=UPI00344AA0E3
MLASRLRPARMTVLLSATAVAAGLISAAPALAVTGPEAPADAHKSVVKLAIGDEANSRACTATLVDARWVLTAASCFAATPGASVPAGKPALKSIATLSDGKAVEIAELAPRGDRDLVLARLATATTGIAGVKRASAVPATGADLTAVGFGRTKTEWVPGKLHVGAFSVSSSDATALTIAGKGTDAICKGDTGGPLLNTAGELVGVNSRSWQGGCLGTAASETRTGALSVRTDDLGAWVGQVTAPRNGAQVSLLAGGGGTMWSQSGNLGYGEYGQSWAKADGKDVSRVSTVRHGETVRAYAIAGGRVYGQDLDLATGKWSGWGEAPGGAAGAKDITASLVGDSVHVQIIGSDGAVWTQFGNYDAGRWNDTWVKGRRHGPDPYHQRSHPRRHRALRPRHGRQGQQRHHGHHHRYLDRLQGDSGRSRRGLRRGRGRIRSAVQGDGRRGRGQLLLHPERCGRHGSVQRPVGWHRRLRDHPPHQRGHRQHHPVRRRGRREGLRPRVRRPQQHLGQLDRDPRRRGRRQGRLRRNDQQRSVRAGHRIER